MTVPKLRFPEFEDEWETVKFDKLVEFTGKKNSKNLPLESFSISNENGFIPQEKQFEGCSSLQNADKSLYYIVTPNSFAYNPARINVGSIGYYEGKKDVIVSSLYEIFKTNDKLEDCFLQQWLKTNSFAKQIAKFQEGGVRQYYYFDKMCMSEISMPENIEEQQKIGSFFSEIDNFISLNEEKLTELQNLKKSLMQKMFPKDGEVVPEIRFPGFDGEWIEKKMGDIIETLPFKAYLKEPEEKGEYEIIQQGNNPILGFANGTPCTDYEDIVIFGDHTLSLYKPQKPFFVATDGVRIIKGKEKMDGLYLLMLLEKYKPQSEGYKRYFSILANSYCFITENHEEQQKIGSFFKELNNRIVLQKQKLDEIKEYKKGLLQQMFC